MCSACAALLRLWQRGHEKTITAFSRVVRGNTNHSAIVCCTYVPKHVFLLPKAPCLSKPDDKPTTKTNSKYGHAPTGPYRGHRQLTSFSPATFAVAAFSASEVVEKEGNERGRDDKARERRAFDALLFSAWNSKNPGCLSCENTCRQAQPDLRCWRHRWGELDTFLWFN